jgi:hypothetical protein
MATLTYGTTGTTIEMDGRQLAHLQYILGQRFRRQEALLLTFTTGDGADRLRRTVWLTPSSPVEFTFDADVSYKLNREWLEQLMQQSYSAQGVVLTAEPGSETDPRVAGAAATSSAVAG